jgi:hypothetical protein
MSRTQITLDPDLQRRARQRAAKLGVSFAEYVRRVVERDLGGTSRSTQGVAAVFDLGSSGGADVARDKDTMVARAFARRASRRR